MSIKYAKSYDEFQENSKEFVINMDSSSYKLHKKNCCHYSTCLINYKDFDILEEAKRSRVEFKKCGFCSKKGAF